jgi:hypothetical protein
LEVNEWREARDKPPLEISPGIRWLDYGSKKDGWWDFEKLEEQNEDVFDCCEVLLSNFQIVGMYCGCCVLFLLLLCWIYSQTSSMWL